MLRRSILVLGVVTLFIVLDQVNSMGFNWFADGDKKDGDNNNKPFFEFFGGSYDEKRRAEGKSKMRFAMWNRKNKHWVEVKRNSSSVPKAWNKGSPLKLLIHSYSKDTGKPSQEIIASQKIFKIGYAYGNDSTETNVVVVDWTPLGVEPESRYNFVVNNVPHVAEVVTEFLSKLIKAENIKNASDIHIVGYGMGSHIAGVVGKQLKNKKHGGKPGRITGLDPAGVGFDDEGGLKPKNKSSSLTKTDADFVDVIHCNIGTAKTHADARWQGRYGSAVQAGHADFYPNGGSEQPACKHVSDQVGDKDCHTKMCPEFFVKSIEGVEYKACECQDWDDFEADECECTLEDKGTLMGEKCSKTAKGKYFLKANGTEKVKKKKTDAKKSENEDNDKEDKDDEDEDNEEKEDKDEKEKKDKKKDKDKKEKDKNEKDKKDKKKDKDEGSDKKKSKSTTTTTAAPKKKKNDDKKKTSSGTTTKPPKGDKKKKGKDKEDEKKGSAEKAEKESSEKEDKKEKKKAESGEKEEKKGSSEKDDKKESAEEKEKKDSEEKADKKDSGEKSKDEAGSKEKASGEKKDDEDEEEETPEEEKPSKEEEEKEASEEAESKEKEGGD